jgi:cyclic peptide transporter
MGRQWSRALPRALVGSSALLDLLRSHSPRFGYRLLGLVALSGLSNAGLLAVINTAAENASNLAANGRFLALFAIVLAIYLVAQREILRVTVNEVERILDGVRGRLTGRLRDADLMPIEHLGRPQIYASIQRDTLTISQAAQMIAMACQSTVMLVFAFAYLAWLSRAAFGLTLVATVISAGIYLRRSEETSARMHLTMQREHDFLDALTHMLDGFKEVRLSEPRATELHGHLRQMSTDLAGLKVQTGTGFAEQLILGQSFFYLLLGAIVFLLPQVANQYTDVVTKATASVLFIVGPLSSLLVTVPIYANANVSAGNIVALDEALARAAPAVPPPSPLPPAAAVEHLCLTDMVFEYDDPRAPHPFTVGPLDFSVRAGETVFIIGGNGSGKSTFLKVLAGLYPASSGTMALNGTVIGPGDAAWYRSHFSAVFSDYHLFDRLYGLGNGSRERAQELLGELGLSDKTALDDRRFTTLDLSVGQRKRLALLVLLLENRPIVVFDEWAAEQDPAFRRRFYEDLLPAFKREGRTVIAVTHDDRYYRSADRILKMEYGVFVDAGIARDGSPDGTRAEA